MLPIFLWAKSNKLFIFVALFTVLIFTYRCQAIYYKDQVDIAKTELLVKEEVIKHNDNTIKQGIKRQKLIKKVITKQNKEVKNEENAINNRVYFDKYSAK